MKRMNKELDKRLADLYSETFHCPLDRIEALPASGSARRYFRLSGAAATVIATHYPELKENRAFIGYTNHFISKKLPVPHIIAVNQTGDIYLQEDLGDCTLFHFLETQRLSHQLPESVVGVYRKVVCDLVRFQLEGGDGIDYRLAYPRAAFDRQSLQWDLNYFKYYFLKPSGVAFHEQLLEQDFSSFMDYLMEVDSGFFMFRDFQARNIMLVEGEPKYIDYQGGRKGPLQYDLASLLYQARAALPQTIREELLDLYLLELNKKHPVDETAFRQQFDGFVLIRLMQVLGAYGFRGWFEKKAHFLKSISFALMELKQLLLRLDQKMLGAHLWQVLNALCNLPEAMLPTQQADALVVHVNSFSYLNGGVPIDYSGHGGGYAFDCRLLPNPGRLDAYKALTGNDQAVQEYLEKEEAVHQFLERVYSLVDQSVKQYQKRGFQHLTVNFGCTGGQHRSVYCANQLAAHLRDFTGVQIILHHVEQEKKGS